MKKLVMMISVVFLVSAGSAFSFQNDKGKVALIDLSGSITPSSSSGFSSSGITPGEVRDLNDEAVNQGADAIIYEINSGGGAVVASKEVYRDIEDVEVPTVCRMRDVAASGGYLIALGCDKIVADSATLTGSIGVKSSYLEYSGLLDKLGVEYVQLSNGSLKELGSPYQNISDRERAELQDKVDAIHEEFVTQVDSNRNLTESSRNEVATSQPFLGDNAKDLGLVDELGGRDTAVNTAENMTGKELKTFRIETQPNFSFLSLLTGDSPVGDLFRSSSLFKAEIW